MHKGEFVGNNAKNQSKRILILGESHHWSKEDWELQPGETEDQGEERRRIKAEQYSTKCVLKRYLDNYTRGVGGTRDVAYRFFDYIVRTFNLDPEQERDEFWDKVYFGNYVDKLCGVRDLQAQNAIKINNKLYNESLFEFLNKEHIDYVFCFSRRAYEALPALEEHDIPNKKDGTDPHRIEMCVYMPGARKNIPVTLYKRVVIYGLRHTSQGYSYRKYQERIDKIIKTEKLFK